MLTHPAFKHSKFVCLSSVDKTTYLSFKLRDYFHKKNYYQPDAANGLSHTFFDNQVCVSDFYDEIHDLLKEKFCIPRKNFVEDKITLNDTLKRLLKQHDLEKSFRSCFDTFVSPVFEKLVVEACQKKHAEALRVSEEMKKMKEQEQIKLELLNKEKREKEEKEKKIVDFKKMVLEMGTEWEEEEEEDTSVLVTA